VYWPKKPEFVKPDVSFDKHRLEEEREALIAVARGCPLPFDFVLSSGSDSSHWSRKNMREETIEVAVTYARLFDGMIGKSLFARFFEIAGLDPDEWRLTSDPSTIAVKADITEAVKYAHESGILSDEGYLEANGIPQDMWVSGVKGSGKNTPKETAEKAAKQAETAPKPAMALPAGKKPVVDDTGVTAPDTELDVEPKLKSSSTPDLLAQLQASGLLPFPSEVTKWDK
jgi:hypothetical protein